MTLPVTLGRKEGQGHQQDYLPQQGQEQAGPGLTKGHEGALAGHLGAEGPDAPEEEGHDPGHQLDQLLLRGVKIRASTPGIRATMTKAEQVTVMVTASSRLKVCRTRR